MPRGHLLSVMRQKVSKERSQEGCAPLANPHRFLACPLRKFGPSPTPLEAMQNPGWGAERHPSGTLTGKKPNKSLNRPQG